MAKRFDDLNSKVWWNLLLITVGTLIYTIGIQGIVVHHGFVPGGVFGLSLLLTYVNPFMSPGILYLLLNVPLFLLGWIHVSRRFFFYSLYAMVLTAVAFELIHLDLGIQEQIYAAIAAGAVGGFGVGIVLRSLGSNGGLDIVAIILNQKFNIGIGKIYFFFNLFLYGTGAAFLAIDTIVASLILIFAT
ncbi:MAG: YitT family protein, partial [Myxococcota bacterium]|nr:YitT family protein [Myxococcota bacterium]